MNHKREINLRENIIIIILIIMHKTTQFLKPKLRTTNLTKMS